MSLTLTCPGRVVLDVPGDQFPHTAAVTSGTQIPTSSWEDLNMNQAVFGTNFENSDADGPYKKGMLWKVKFVMEALCCTTSAICVRP